MSKSEQSNKMNERSNQPSGNKSAQKNTTTTEKANHKEASKTKGCNR